MEAPDLGYSTKTNLDAARATNVPLIGTYPWLDPGDNPAYALNRYSEAAYREQPNGIWIDMEQDRDANGVFYSPSQVEDRLQHLLEGMRYNFPDIVIDIYSRPDFIRKYCPNILKWYRPQMPGMAAWPSWGLLTEYQPLANIVAGNTRQCLDISAPDPKPFSRINIFDGAHGPDLSSLGNPPYCWWQSTTREWPSEFIGTIFNHQYDIGFINLSLANLKLALRLEPIGESIMTTALWDTAIPQNGDNSRAWGFEWEPNQKLAPGVTMADIVGSTGWLDFVELPMMTTKWNGNHMTFQPEGTFPGRFDMVHTVKAPVFGIVTLDAAIGPLEQAELSNYQNVPNEQNHALMYFLKSWIVEDTWTLADVNANKVHFRPISQINVRMVETHTFPWGSDKTKFLEDQWQQCILEYFINPLKALMDGGHTPVVPIAFKTTSDWLERYDKSVGNWLLTHNSWIYLSMIQDINPSTATFDDFGGVFSYIIPEDFNFHATKPNAEGKFYRYPDTFFKRILAHQFGSEQKVDAIVDVNNVPVKIKVTKYFTNKNAAYEFLNFTLDTVTLPVDPGKLTLEQAVAALQSAKVVIDAALAKV
jgi:hypothetical protein